MECQQHLINTVLMAALCCSERIVLFFLPFCIPIAGANKFAPTDCPAHPTNPHLRPIGGNVQPLTSRKAKVEPNGWLGLLKKLSRCY
jgi:hypothetical protein